MYHYSDIIVENENEITKYMVTKFLVAIDIVCENLKVHPIQIQEMEDRKFRDLEG